ncbi:RDD family protein [Leptospira sp. WS60.C2]
MFKIRLLASIIDVILLIAVTYLVSFFNIESYNVQLSINLSIAFAYFSIFNSKIFKGKTIGKAICKISVQNQFFGNLSLIRSCLRAFILILPFYILFYDIESGNFTKDQYKNILSLKTYFSVPLLSFIIISSIFDIPLHRGLHEIVSQSVVIKNKYTYLAFPYQRKVIISAFIGSVIITLISLILNIFFIESRYPSAESKEHLSLLQIVNNYPSIVFLKFKKNDNEIFMKINVPINEFENNLPKILKEWRSQKQSSFDLYKCKINLTYISKPNFQLNDYTKYSRTDELNSKKFYVLFTEYLHTAYNNGESLRFGTCGLAWSATHSSPSRFLALARSAPTLTPTP